MKTSTKILIGVGVLALIGGVSFYLYKRNKPKVEIKKSEKQTPETTKENTPLKEPIAKVQAPKEISLEEANKIAQQIKLTADSEKKQKLTLGYISPNLARFQTLKQAGYNYSNGIATKN